MDVRARTWHRGAQAASPAEAQSNGLAKCSPEHTVAAQLLLCKRTSFPLGYSLDF